MADFSTEDLQKRFIRETGIAAEIAAIAEPLITDLGMRLVKVSISSQSGTTVQIMADRPDDAISVDDCAMISRQLSPLLDAHDPIKTGYVLEVSSPGIARPLVRPSDFEDWAGHEAKVELQELVDGRRRFRGILEGYENGEALIRVELKDHEEPQLIGLPLALISEAKLVLTDDLLKLAQTANRSEDAGSEDRNGDNLE